jgi:hypothetical protein
MNATTTFTLARISNSALRDALSLQALGCPIEVETAWGWLMALPWETGRVHRLLANHPERRISVPDWALPNFDVVRGWCDECRGYWRRRRCEHSWPTPILPPELQQQELDNKGGVSCWDIVNALAAAGCHPVVRGAFKWRALCPVCRMRGKFDRRVYVERNPETGRDRLSTFCHCDVRDIFSILGLPMPGRKIHLWGEEVA